VIGLAHTGSLISLAIRRRVLEAGMESLRVAAFATVVFACGSQASIPPPGRKPIDPRIARVEAALVPANAIRGQPTGDMSLRGRMAHFKIPAVSVAVVDRGQLAWARAYGTVEPGGAPATTRTMFQAGSVSKPVAAMAALRLVQDGVLALDQDVNRRLRSWRVPASELTAGAPVTLRGLLSHTAGLTVRGFPGYEMGGPVPELTAVLDGRPPANTKPVRVTTRPGTEFRYSGGGYCVAQQLVIDATRRQFPDVAQKLVFGPLGMRDSTYEQPLPAERRARAATGTAFGGEPVKGRWHVYPEMAAGGLWSTPTDLARIIIELQSGHRVLTEATARTMLTPVMQDYGLGIVVEGSGPGRRFTHAGDDAGFRALLVGTVTGGRGAVVMVNSDSGSPITGEIVRAIAREYEWPDYPGGEVRDVVAIPADRLRRYEGLYEDANDKLRVALTDRGLVLLDAANPADRLALHASSETVFFATDDAIEIEFVVQGDAVIGMRLRYAGGSLELRRVP
jgi:CubicO group peptidase (beta-lactamase class C family)